jgi:hypothetical protein
VPEALSLILAVRPLPDGEDARYDRGRRRVMVAESLVAEDPRLVAIVLAYERGGIDGLRARLSVEGVYQDECAERSA